MFDVGSQRRRRVVGFAKKRRRGSKRQQPWWKAWFSDWNDEEESLAGWREDDELLQEVVSDEDLPSEDDKFQTWKRKAEAIVELREAQQDAENAEGRSWEDWIGGGSTAATGGGDWGGGGSLLDQISDDPTEIVRDKGLIETFKNSIDEDYEDMLFEDRVFLYASSNSVCTLTTPTMLVSTKVVYLLPNK
jgi:hypothetical protein